MTGFALLPEDGTPPRLIRFTTLTGGLVAQLDRQKNILRVDKGYYDLLRPQDQWTVDTTHQDLWVEDRGAGVIGISTVRTHAPV